MFALVMLFVFTGLIALVGDAAVMMFTYDQADSAALLGAQAGASQVDLALLYQQNQTVLSLGQAQQVCQDTADQALHGNGHATCDAAGGITVTATVTDQVRLPIPLFGASETVTAVRSARAVFGGANPN